MPGTDFPAILKALHQLPFDYLDGEGIDFEPYTQFLTPEETTEWLRAWTGCDSVNGDAFRVFGQDGSGGLAAFWLVSAEVPVLQQPIVFFGSEGELGVVAGSFYDYLWLLAEGIGPFEATSYGAEQTRGTAIFRDFANSHAADHNKSPSEILEDARRRYPDFEEMVQEMCE